MLNPMIAQMQSGILGQIKNMMSVVKSSPNPQAAMLAMAKQNPQLRQAYEYVNANGGDPKQAFYKMAQEKGIDPNEIINMIK